MGLDITAYRQIKKAPEAALDEDGNPIDWQRYWRAHKISIEWAEEHFPGRSEGVEPDGIYSFEGEALRFRAGSYGGYNRWRDSLARMVGHASSHVVFDTKTTGPFTELLNFADNEGVIGPVVGAKLAKDFADHQAKADTWDDDWFRDRYALWRKAFEMAADGGAVDFH